MSRMKPNEKEQWRIRTFIVLALFLCCTPRSVSADMVWSQKLNRLVRVGEEIKPTDQEQFEYINTLLNEGKRDDALTACHDLINFFPQSGFLPDVYFTAGKLLEEMKEYYKAFEMYQKIVEEYPSSPLIQELLDRQFAIGMKFLEGERLRIKGIPTLSSPTKAIEVFEQVKKSAPFHEYGERSQFNIGLAYEQKKDYEKALAAFEDLLEEYPNTSLAAEASFKRADLVYKLSQKNIDNEAMLASASEKVDEFISTHPEEHTSYDQASGLKTKVLDTQAENLYKIGRFYESQRHLESAKIYYAIIVDKYPMTSWKAKAEQRMAIFADPEGELLKEEHKLQAELEEVEKGLEELEGQRVTLSKAAYKEQRDVLDEEKKVIKKGLKAVKRQKVREIKLRWAVHKRQTKELKANKKALAQKKRSLSPKVSAEAEHFLKTWEMSIKDQEFLLAQEAETLRSISQHLGYRRWSVFAYIQPPIEFANIDRAIKYKEKKRAALRHERQVLGRQADKLVDERNALRSHLDEGAGADAGRVDEKIVHDDAIVPVDKASAGEDRSQGLLGAVAARSLDIVTSPVSLVTAPFHSDDGEKLAHAREREEALAVELEEVKGAMNELDRLVADADDALLTEGKEAGQPPVRAADAQEIDARQKRRMVKELEKKINEQYRIIDDAEKQKHEYSTSLIKGARESRLAGRPLLRAATFVLKPITFIGKGVSAFFFGIKDEQALVTAELAQMKANDDRIDDLHDKIVIEQEKIDAAKAELKELYAQRDALPRETTSVFRSILIFPENIFAGEEAHTRQTREYLSDMQKEQAEKYAMRDKELAAIREEIAILEKTQDAARGSEAEEETSESKNDDAIRQELTGPVPTGMRGASSKDTQTLRKVVGKILGVLEEEEKIERGRLARIDKIMKEHEGKTSEKLERLAQERKVIFANLDDIMTTRERYLLIVEEIKRTE